MKNIMLAKDAMTGAAGRCFSTILGNRYELMNAINIQLDYKKKKVKVPLLGKPGGGNKSGGIEYSGKAKFHYNTSILRKLIHHYQETGIDVYFDMQITNEDETSDAGRQTIIAYDCNIDGGVLARFDADSEYLDEELEFTFERFDIPEEFNMLTGMQ